MRPRPLVSQMQKLPLQTKLTIDGPAGELEALLEVPRETPPIACVVVCHPHPLHGGTMLNKVAHTLARGFVGINFAAIRFNFRGVGKSQGNFDDGNGELADVLAAVEFSRDKFPGLDLWLAGFSFGAAMAVRAAVNCDPAGLVSIAPAISRFANNLESQPNCPWLIVQGDQDELVDIDETVAWVDDLQAGPELLVLPGAEHFFHGRLIELRDSVQTFVNQNMESR